MVAAGSASLPASRYRRPGGRPRPALLVPGQHTYRWDTWCDTPAAAASWTRRRPRDPNGSSSVGTPNLPACRRDDAGISIIPARNASTDDRDYVHLQRSSVHLFLVVKRDPASRE